jgi:hypothetical protein
MYGVSANTTVDSQIFFRNRVYLLTVIYVLTFYYVICYITFRKNANNAPQMMPLVLGIFSSIPCHLPPNANDIKSKALKIVISDKS